MSFFNSGLEVDAEFFGLGEEPFHFFIKGEEKAFVSFFDSFVKELEAEYGFSAAWWS